MKIYFSAFIWALLLILLAGIVTESLVWVLLDALHASKKILFTTEALMILPLLGLFVFVFRHTLGVEKNLAKQAL